MRTSLWKTIHHGYASFWVTLYIIYILSHLYVFSLAGKMLTFNLVAFQQHDFSLEKKVLYWIDSASRQEIPWFNGTTNTYPTAPPCWLLLVDSKENGSHKATDCKTKEMPHAQSCLDLSTRFERPHCPGGRRKMMTKRGNLDQCSEKQEGSEGKESPSGTSEENDREERLEPVPGALPQLFDLSQSRPKTSPGYLSAVSESSCLRSVLGKQRQSTYFLNNVKDELEGAKKKLMAAIHPLNGTTTDSALVSKAFSLHQHTRSSRNFRFGSGPPPPRLAQTLIPAPPSTSCCKPSHLHSPRLIRPIQHHKPIMAVSSNLFPSWGFSSFLSHCVIQSGKKPLFGYQ